MLITPSRVLLVAAAASIALPLDASAASRFTVQNDTEKGKDTKSLGCKGNGKGKCKIKIFSFDERGCKESQNTCSGRAIKMQAKSKAIVSETSEINDETGVREFETVCEIVEQK